MLASRSITGANNDFKDIYLGTSPKLGVEDDGVSFSWTPFLHVNSSAFGIQDVHLQPHPSQPGIWFGIASVAGKGSTWRTGIPGAVPKSSSPYSTINPEGFKGPWRCV